MITLPGTTSMVTPLAKSTLITQSLQMPTISAALPYVRDILEPASYEEVRSAYLERQKKQMDSVALPSGMPSLEDEMIPRPESLQHWIQFFVKRKKIKGSRNGKPIGWLWKNKRKQRTAMPSMKPRRKGHLVCPDVTEFQKN